MPLWSVGLKVSIFISEFYRKLNYHILPECTANNPLIRGRQGKVTQVQFKKVKYLIITLEES